MSQEYFTNNLYIAVRQVHPISSYGRYCMAKHCGDIRAALSRGTHSDNQDNQEKFRIFYRFDLIYTLGLSEILFKSFCFQGLRLH